MRNHTESVRNIDKLQQLENEMKGAVTGLPPDPTFTDLIGKLITLDYPNADLQIIVSSSRKTTTTKSFYETETPGMVNLDLTEIQNLHKKLLKNISTSKKSDDLSSSGPLPTGLHVPDVEIDQDSAIQKKETFEEGYADNDGTEVVSKKMTRFVTTSQSAISGLSPEEEKNENQSEGNIMRLKINQQIYHGNLDPTSKQMHFIPIKQLE